MTRVDACQDQRVPVFFVHGINIFFLCRTSLIVQTDHYHKALRWYTFFNFSHITKKHHQKAVADHMIPETQKVPNFMKQIITEDKTEAYKFNKEPK